MIIRLNKKELEEFEKLLSKKALIFFEGLKKQSKKTVSERQLLALEKARESKRKKVIEKLKKSALKIEQKQKKITKYSLAKSSGVAYATVIKYFDEVLKEV